MTAGLLGAPQVDRLRTLARLSRVLSSSLDGDGILREIALAAVELTEAKIVSLWVADEESRTLALHAFSDDTIGADLPTRTLRYAEGGVGWVAVHRRPLEIEELSSDRRVVEHDWFRAHDLRAAYAMPIVHEDTLLGVLAMFGERPFRFTGEDRDLLDAFVAQAAVAIKNARLFAASEARRREAEALAEVGRLFVQSLDPEDVAQRIAESLRALLGASAAVVCRLDPESRALAVRARSGHALPLEEAFPEGTGVMGLAVREGGPVATPNILADPRITLPPALRAQVERRGYRSVLAVPLLFKGTVIGAISIGDAEGRRFGADEVRLAQTFADQAAIALENARLHRETEREREKAEELALAAQSLTGTLEVSSVVRHVVERVRDLFGVTAAGLRLLQPDGSLVVTAYEGDSDGRFHPGHTLPPGIGVAGRAVALGQPVQCRDVLAAPGVELNEDLRQRVVESGNRAILAVPVRTKGRTLGALTISDRSARTFSDSEIARLQTFAGQAALALENARLFEDAERRRREAEVGAELSRQINASLELDTILELLAERARELAQADGATIMLREPGGEAATPRHRAGTPLGDARHLRVEPGRGAGGRVLVTGCPFRTENHATDPRITDDYRGLARASGHVAQMVVPILGDERVEGLLYVDRQQARPFTDRDEAMLVGLAEHAAIAIRNGQLLQTLRTHQARLEGLLDVSHELSKIQAVQSALAAVAEACGRVLGSESVGVRLVDGDELVLAGTWGDAGELMSTPRLRMGESLSGIVAATGAPLLLNDVATDPRLLAAHRAQVLRLGHRAWLGVPVKMGDRVIGVLSIGTRRERGFSKEDQAIATALASQAATALENARLFHELEQAYTTVSQTKEELLQSQKMEAIGRLAGGMAHDFNNLLTIVHGRCEILKKRLAPADGSQRDVEIIRQTTRRAAALISQLLAFSRKQVLQPRILGLNALVQDSATLFRRLLGEDVDLVLVTDAEHDRVTADPTQLEQVLMNLAVNARDAMPRGGRLTIGTASVELDEAFAHQHPGARPGPHLALSVSDTGVGMSDEVQARIFEPFFTTKEPGRGTGLGLSTVYGIVRQHNGYLTVASAPGAGTTFTIYLPRAEGAEDMATQERSEPTAPRGSETVLLVEDEDEVRELAREILEMNGYTVLEAADGAGALAVLREHLEPIDLLLTDVVMPGGMSGRDLARQVAGLSPRTRVVYMSGYTDDALGHHGVLDPDIVLLPKPFTPEALLGALRRVLDGPATPGAGA